MSTATVTTKEFMQDYFKALSGNPKTEAFIDKWVADPALKKHILESEAAFPNYQFEPENMVVEGDIAAINGIFTGTNKGPFAGMEATGKTINFRAMVFYRVADGRIAKFWMLVDSISAMAQLKG